jgi:hypothetical protein
MARAILASHLGELTFSLTSNELKRFDSVKQFSFPLGDCSKSYTMPGMP